MADATSAHSLVLSLPCQLLRHCLPPHIASVPGRLFSVVRQCQPGLCRSSLMDSWVCFPCRDLLLSPNGVVGVRLLILTGSRFYSLSGTDIYLILQVAFTSPWRFLVELALYHLLPSMVQWVVYCFPMFTSAFFVVATSFDFVVPGSGLPTGCLAWYGPRCPFRLGSCYCLDVTTVVFLLLPMCAASPHGCGVILSHCCGSVVRFQAALPFSSAPFPVPTLNPT